MMNFRCCCVDWPKRRVNDLIEMIDDSKEVTRKTFIANVGLASLRELETELGYSLHPSQGLTMAADYYVSYHKSKYKGRQRVYFVTQSAIEYVFASEELLS